MPSTCAKNVAFNPKRNPVNVYICDKQCKYADRIPMAWNGRIKVNLKAILNELCYTVNYYKL